MQAFTLTCTTRNVMRNMPVRAMTYLRPRLELNRKEKNFMGGYGFGRKFKKLAPRHFLLFPQLSTGLHFLNIGGGWRHLAGRVAHMHRDRPYLPGSEQCCVRELRHRSAHGDD